MTGGPDVEAGACSSAFLGGIWGSLGKKVEGGCAMLLAGSPIFLCFSVGSTKGSCIPGENEVGSLPKWEKWISKDRPSIRAE